MQNCKKNTFSVWLFILLLFPLFSAEAFAGEGGGSKGGKKGYTKRTPRSFGFGFAPRGARTSYGGISIGGSSFGSGGISIGGTSSRSAGFGTGCAVNRTTSMGGVSISGTANPGQDNSNYSLTAGPIRYTPGRIEIEEKDHTLHRTPDGTLREGKKVMICEVHYEPAAAPKGSDSMNLKKYREQSGKCAFCKKLCRLEDMVSDYMVPLSEGGKAVSSNLLMICHECDAEYNGPDPE